VSASFRLHGAAAVRFPLRTTAEPGPVTTHRYPPEVLRLALDLADGDPRRLRYQADGIVVANHARHNPPPGARA
jgi:hypothetical protein